MKIQEIKEGFGNLLDSVAEGWHHLRESAANALTRFKPGQQTQLPAREEIDDPLYLPARGWSMLGGEVFEDDTRLVVRLEMPGMDKQNIAIDVRDDALVVSGEKRFERETTEGRWRVMQCAYGSFRRVVPLAAPVDADQTRASYRNGVLRIDLPNVAPGKPKSINIKLT
ncbi:MAG: Hsp20/alpha crystallin family protein [Candidatus Accumulibacter sp.]|uniref:Hsp20/alpha crystallin family protein n=1 Tax=Accumulibacter sp. TaxID=2053492 RepID=UPI002587C139|nr:Hsp20/alpha crystallin family protein [Accumulibacter sp.]MCM8622804.1 Hsp20/alpha crystallin family protein [Accumulibacter sp.]